MPISSRALEAIAEFFLAHRLLGGLVLVAVGAFMTYDGIKTGTEYARFVDGPSVTGTVTELRGDATLPAHYEMTAEWRDSRKQSHSATLDLFKGEFEALSEGSEVELRLARDDPARAIVAAHVDNDKPIVIRGVSMTPLALVGVAMAVFGVGFAISGLVPKRVPDARPVARPVARRPPPRRP